MRQLEERLDRLEAWMKALAQAIGELNGEKKR
jgi:hypothetical protein